MKKITLRLFCSFSNSTYTLENNKQVKISTIKNLLLLTTILLFTNLVNAQEEISYTVTSNIHGVETLTNVTELNDDDPDTYKKIRAVNSVLNIDTSNDTELSSYSLKASNHTDILFDSGMTENATGTESFAIGSGLIGNSLIIGGTKNTLKASLTGLGVTLDEFTFSSLIKIASGTTGTVTLLSLETAATPAEHVVFYYDIDAQEFSVNYKGKLKLAEEGGNGAFALTADTQYQISIVITESKLNIYVDQSNVANWKIGGGIPADSLQTAYLGYDNLNATTGSLIEYDGSYFFNEKLFASNQGQIHDDTRILVKVPVAGSEFEFGARFWSLYGLVDAVDEFGDPFINKILIDEQTNQSFTNGEQKDFNITPGAQYQNYEVRFKGFAMSELKLKGPTALSVDKFSINDFSIKKDQNRLILESKKHFNYQVYDITGKLIKEQTKKTQSSSIQLVESSVYILKMQIENQVITKKFIM